MQHHDETAFEKLERIVEWIGREHGSVRNDLPTVEAVVEYADVMNACGCLSSQDIWADPEAIDSHGRAAWDAFVRRWHLVGWRTFEGLAQQPSVAATNGADIRVPVIVAVVIAFACGLLGF